MRTTGLSFPVVYFSNYISAAIKGPFSYAMGASPVRSCGIKAHILRRSLQLGFQVQNDIVEQTSRNGIRSFSFQNSVALHLIFALFPIFAVSHGDGPPCSDPQREYISSSN